MCVCIYIYIYRLLAVLRTNLRRFEQNSQNILLHCINFYFYKPASVLFVVLFYGCKEVTTNLRILHTLRSSDINFTFLCATVIVTVALQTVFHKVPVCTRLTDLAASYIHSLVSSVRRKPQE